MSRMLEYCGGSVTRVSHVGDLGVPVALVMAVMEHVGAQLEKGEEASLCVCVVCVVLCCVCVCVSASVSVSEWANTFVRDRRRASADRSACAHVYEMWLRLRPRPTGLPQSVVTGPYTVGCLPTAAQLSQLYLFSKRVSEGKHADVGVDADAASDFKLRVSELLKDIQKGSGAAPGTRALWNRLVDASRIG